MSDDRPTISISPGPGAPPASSTAETLLTLSEERDPVVVAAAVSEVEPHDAAHLLSQLPPERAGAVVPLLEPGQMAQIVTQMDADRAAEVLESMHPDHATAVLAELSPDDRVDILDELPEEKHDELVAGLDAEDRAEVRLLEQYAPDTAGGIMTPEVTKLYEYLSVQDAIETLRRLHEELEQMFYVYVIDRHGHLCGVLSMRDLILARPETRLSEIMIPRDKVRALPADMDQEEVANLFRRYHYLAMPVVDRHERLIGLVTVDDVVDVMQEETTEDVHKLFGAGAEEKLTSPWYYSFQKRVGWLGVNLLTAFVGAAVVAAFQGTIAQLAILAAFLPIVSAVGGNASVQAMAVTVRGLAAGRVDRALLRQVLVRELKVGVVAGIVIGLLMFGITVVTSGHDVGWSRAAEYGTVVAAAMVANLTLGCLVGTSVPVLMQRLGFDPAQSATIFTTAITDAVGFLLLLALAATFLL